jgi:hypothetical protein
MQTADSTAQLRRPPADAILRALERLTENERLRSERASGFYARAALPVDEFAGLERLDREELDDE